MTRSLPACDTCGACECPECPTCGCSVCTVPEVALHVGPNGYEQCDHGQAARFIGDNGFDDRMGCVGLSKPCRATYCPRPAVLSL